MTMSMRDSMELLHPTNRVLSLLILLLNFSFFLFRAPPSHATDSIRWGGSLCGNQTIVSRGGRFVLGFFSPGNSHNYYVGIWYKKIPGQTVIWVANRYSPLSRPESAELKISHDGNLVLLNHSRTPIWSSNVTSSRSSSRVAVLLDTGNLVLMEGPDSPAFIWQSFDHPTDTWVPGAEIGMNKITGEYQILTSWKNSEDPSPGMFSHHIDLGGSSDYFSLWNGSVVYDHLGEWDGDSFRLVPHATLSSFFRVRFVETKERKYIACDPCGDYLSPIRLVLEVFGQLKLWSWLENDQTWMLIWSRPAAQCDVYSVCGAFGICNQMNFPACSCLPGFEPKSLKDWNLNDWSGGCVRKSSLQCVGNNTLDVFREMADVKLPTGSQNLPVADAEECKLACLSNCSCSACAYDGACLIWNGELHNLQQLSGADGNSGTLYLRLTAQEHSQSGRKRKIFVAAILGCILGVLILSSIVLTSMVCRSWRRTSATIAIVMDGSLFQFSYSVLLQITKKFSVQLGRGGFGCVFVGELPDSTLVAVKRLEGLRQGEKQFRAEVRTLGTVQHVNLVRLRGFCSEGDRRLLVYDYMPNRSLDVHLFRAEPPYLSWKRRYQIALGTARGLAYLHEECREHIIHCDIKPENILLDESYQPKVADFGMAKLIARDFTRVLTSTRGTIGYLAPEWLSGLAITPKVDVYSFGMMLFELVSGRRNTEVGGGGKTTYFPFLAAYTIIEGGDVLCLLDHRLGGDADVEELTRVCRAASWCVQDEESGRPTMGQVVQILEGVGVPSVPPMPGSLLYLLQSWNDSNSM